MCCTRPYSNPGMSLSPYSINFSLIKVANQLLGYSIVSRNNAFSKPGSEFIGISRTWLGILYKGQGLPKGLWRRFPLSSCWLQRLCSQQSIQMNNISGVFWQPLDKQLHTQSWLCMRTYLWLWLNGHFSVIIGKNKKGLKMLTRGGQESREGAILQNEHWNGKRACTCFNVDCNQLTAILSPHNFIHCSLIISMYVSYSH